MSCYCIGADPHKQRYKYQCQQQSIFSKEMSYGHTKLLMTATTFACLCADDTHEDCEDAEG